MLLWWQLHDDGTKSFCQYAALDAIVAFIRKTHAETRSTSNTDTSPIRYHSSSLMIPMTNGSGVQVFQRVVVSSKVDWSKSVVAHVTGDGDCVSRMIDVIVRDCLMSIVLWP